MSVLSVAGLIGWRQARDTGKSLPPAESAELEALARGAQLQLGHFGKKVAKLGMVQMRVTPGPQNQAGLRLHVALRRANSQVGA